MVPRPSRKSVTDFARAPDQSIPRSARTRKANGLTAYDRLDADLGGLDQAVRAVDMRGTSAGFTARASLTPWLSAWLSNGRGADIAYPRRAHFLLEEWRRGRCPGSRHRRQLIGDK